MKGTRARRLGLGQLARAAARLEPGWGWGKQAPDPAMFPPPYESGGGGWGEQSRENRGPEAPGAGFTLPALAGEGHPKSWESPLSMRRSLMCSGHNNNLPSSLPSRRSASTSCFQGQGQGGRGRAHGRPGAQLRFPTPLSLASCLSRGQIWAHEAKPPEEGKRQPGWWGAPRHKCHGNKV